MPDKKNGESAPESEITLEALWRMVNDLSGKVRRSSHTTFAGGGDVTIDADGITLKQGSTGIGTSDPSEVRWREADGDLSSSIQDAVFGAGAMLRMFKVRSSGEANLQFLSVYADNNYNSIDGELYFNLGDTSTNFVLRFVDGSGSHNIITVIYGSSSKYLQFNEDNSDVDFWYETVNGDLAFYVDAALDKFTTLAWDGWYLAKETWTRTGNHTFTISGNVTTKYRKGTKVRYKDGGAYEYGVIASSSYGAPNTTVTLITNSDYAMAAASITDAYISYIQNPEGFPVRFNYTSTLTSSGGTLGGYTQQVAYWEALGNGALRVITSHLITSVGTGTGAALATIPVNSVSISNGSGRENAVTGYQLQTIVAAATAYLAIRIYDNSSPLVVNYQLMQSTVYTY